MFVHLYVNKGVLLPQNNIPISSSPPIKPPPFWTPTYTTTTKNKQKTCVQFIIFKIFKNNFVCLKFIEQNNIIFGSKYLKRKKIAFIPVVMYQILF